MTAHFFSDLTPEAEAERIRCMRIIEAHRRQLMRVGLWPQLWHTIVSGVEPTSAPVDREFSERALRWATLSH